MVLVVITPAATKQCLFCLILASVNRAAFLGAIHGAKEGIDSIPVDWMSKVKDIEMILAKVIKFFKKPRKTPKPYETMPKSNYLI